MTPHEAFYSFIAALPEAIRADIELSAYDNGFADDVKPYGPYQGWNDPRYIVALDTAKMIADDPAAYGLTAADISAVKAR